MWAKESYFHSTKVPGKTSGAGTLQATKAEGRGSAEPHGMGGLRQVAGVVVASWTLVSKNTRVKSSQEGALVRK